ncbi:ATP-grasp domain-containing protein [Streptomyces sp. NPDC002172]
MKNVLLINSGRENAARALQQREDINLSVITMPEYAHYYSPGVDVEVIDTVEDLTQVRLAALRIRARNPFDYVVAPSEWSIQAGGYIRSYFGLPGTGYAVSNAFSNKFVMKQELAAAGLSVANFRRLDAFGDAPAAGDDLGWPIVVKRAFGGGSEDVFVVRDADHALALAGDDSTANLRAGAYPLMAEELIDIETEFHCDGIVVDGEVRFAPVSRYFAPVLRSVGGVIGSYTLPDDHPDAEIITALHERVVAALGLTDGVTHLEVLKCSRGYLIGEIACRTGGGGITPQLEHQYGVDQLSALLELSMGGMVDVKQPPRTDHMIQYMLPRPLGTVTEVTPVRELLAVPGVVHAEVKIKAGDVFHGPLDSSVYAGIVVMRAADEDQVAQRVTEIGRRFRVTVAEGTDAQPVLATVGYDRVG